MIHLIIHGHFYQPPRENPWYGRIERQDSAFPYHDWNERIDVECYRANCASRVLDGYGRIVDIVNNFHYLSYNVGPTLCQWLSEHDPLTYEKIIGADRRSGEFHNGHGNAIAQVYNHVIMPLASHDDKITQIRWGIRDFEHRFKRMPRGIWLAETAIDADTAECLVCEGIKFVILSPEQARGWRAANGSRWRSASRDTFNPHIPYILKTLTGELTVFFFDKHLSREISFGNLLNHSENLARAVQNAVQSSGQDHRFVCVATDGETFGHHKAFGDMCLAYFFSRDCTKYNIKVTNFEELMDRLVPDHEIRLGDGGSSWTCVHGVERWRGDCGCTTGSEPGWTQKWRAPLREAIDLLASQVHELMMVTCSGLLIDVQAAINDYINVIIDPSAENRQLFLREHRKKNLEKHEESCIMNLLEACRFSLYSQTSCGWFFAELTGLEPVQNLKYMARTIQHIRQSGLEYDITKTLDILANAKSNKEQVTAKDILMALMTTGTWSAESAGKKTFLREQRLRKDEDRSLALKRWLEELLRFRAFQLDESFPEKVINRICDLLKSCESCNIIPDLYIVQNRVFDLVQNTEAIISGQTVSSQDEHDTHSGPGEQDRWEMICLFAQKLNFNINHWKQCK